MEAILPNGTTQMLSHVNNFNFNWHNNYVYADDAAPLLPKGTILKITSWYDNTTGEQEQPRSESVGRLGRPHRRRDGPRVGEHHLHERRGLPGRTRTAQDLRVRAPLARRSRIGRSAASLLASVMLTLAGRRRPRPGRSGSCRSSRSRNRPERHRRIRGLVPEPRRLLHAARRLLQPQLRSRRSTFRSAPTTASSPAVRTRSAHALPAAPAVGRVHIVVPKDFGKNKLTWTHRRERTDDDRSRCTSIRSGSSRRSRMWRSATRRLGLRFEPKGERHRVHRQAISRSYTQTVSSPLHAERLGHRRWDSGTGGAGRPATPGDRDVEQVPRARRRDIRQAAPVVDEKTGSATTTATFTSRR